MARWVNRQVANRRAGVAAAVLGAACVLGLLSGCAASNQVEHWRLTEQKAPAAAADENAPAQAVHVVFFRDDAASAQADQPINLYINGQYQASLVGKTYTEQSLCPGTHRVAVHFNDVRQRYTTKVEGAPVAVDHRDMQYFRISEDAAGNAVINPVDSSVAKGATGLRLLQSHTLPRVVRNGCAKG